MSVLSILLVLWVLSGESIRCFGPGVLETRRTRRTHWTHLEDPKDLKDRQDRHDHVSANYAIFDRIVLYTMRIAGSGFTSIV